MGTSSNMGPRRLVCILTVLVCLSQASGAFQVKSTGRGRRSLTKRRLMPHRSGMVMYLPSSSPTSQTPPPMPSSQKILTTPGGASRQDSKPRSNSFTLSNSVLASCDTLPSFPTAHGLLSPETVMRMDRMTSRSHRSQALNEFLDTYQRHGPMSCLPMLSDPSVLPHLTEALRDVV